MMLFYVLLRETESFLRRIRSSELLFLNESLFILIFSSILLYQSVSDFRRVSVLSLIGLSLPSIHLLHGFRIDGRSRVAMSKVTRLSGRGSITYFIEKESPGFALSLFILLSVHFNQMFQMPSELGEFFNSIPLVTRYWFTISLALPLLGRIGLINPIWMFLDWDLVVSKFHVSLKYC